MHALRLLTIVLLAAIVTAIGCSPSEEQPVSTIADESLSPERAKDSLLEMMRSDAGKQLGWFDGDAPAEMAKMAIEKGEDGWCSWTGAFSFHPADRVYTFTVRPQSGARACIFAYKGTFKLVDGRWTATPPELVHTALQAGE